MRRMLVGVSLILFCSVLLAASRLGQPHVGRPLEAGAAQTYAQQLQWVITQIMERYLRPSPSADREAPALSAKRLVRPALEGLYETARQPVPASLAREIQEASDQDLPAVMARVRQDLGDDPSLKAPNDLLASCRAMTRVLDPHSMVISGEDVVRSQAPDLNPGFGLEVTDDNGTGPLEINAVAFGGPAQRAGIRPGDQITAIDDQTPEGLDRTRARLRLSSSAIMPTAGAAPSIALTVVRPGTPGLRRLVLQAERFQPETVLGVARKPDNTWDYLADREHQIAQVRIASLGHGTVEEMEQVLTSLRDEGMRGLILDLRWCPGGFLDQSLQFARLFLGKGVIATFKSREENRTAQGGDGQFSNFPMVVLVNGETSGGAELIAAALQDNHRARVAGQRTLGKASVQTVVALPVGDTFLKLTSGMFVRPSGKNLHRFPDSKASDDWGVRPEEKLEFRISPAVSQRLHDLWLLQTLRPGDSTQALPLDDPTADPQRQAAIKGLRTGD